MREKHSISHIDNMFPSVKYRRQWMFAAMFFAASMTQAATYFVNERRPNDGGDGTSWGTAKKTIQAAIILANAAGDEVVVMDGEYAPITTTNAAIVIRSVNGAAATIIDGGGTGRRATLGTDPSHINTVLIGFTLRSGNAIEGGGSYGGTLNNCILMGNTASSGAKGGGGAYGGILNNCELSLNAANYGGGAYGSKLNNCTLTGNTAAGGQGGGAHSCTVNNSVLSGNTAGAGGGAYNSTLNNSTLTGNTAGIGGGAYGGTLNNCVITLNASSSSAGGGAAGSTLNNCLLMWNKCNGFGGGAYNSTLRNCTVAQNQSTTTSTLSYGGGTYGGTMYNCIVWGNVRGANTVDNHTEGLFNYSCTTPLPTGVGQSANTSQNPLFVDAANGDFRLQAGSPCIDKGLDSHAVGHIDLDGNPRIAGTAVDMGAYEYGSAFAVTVLQNGVPVSGVSDGVKYNLGYYKITVPSGATRLVISTSGGTGDVDVYARFASPPATASGSYDGRGSTDGNDETVVFDYPAPGDWFIALYAYAAYSGVTLKAEYTVMPSVPTLAVSPTSQPLGHGAGSFEVEVTTNLPWDAMKSAAWLAVSPASGAGNGSFTVSYEANTAPCSRSAEITVLDPSGSGLTQTITVTQDATPSPHLAVSTTEKTVGSEGDSFEVGIAANVVWVVQILPDWITVSPMSGAGDATLTIACEANTASGARSAEITVSGAGVASKIITITQNAVPTSETDSPEPVPHTWMAQYFPAADIGEYDTIANGDGANNVPVWQSYLAGLDPTNGMSRFLAHIAMENGEPRISWSPDTPELRATRTHITEGKINLTDSTWVSPTNSMHRFFRVKVKIK